MGENMSKEHSITNHKRILEILKKNQCDCDVFLDVLFEHGIFNMCESDTIIEELINRFSEKTSRRFKKCIEFHKYCSTESCNRTDKNYRFYECTRCKKRYCDICADEKLRRNDDNTFIYCHHCYRHRFN